MSKKQLQTSKQHFNCVAKTRYVSERIAEIRAQQVGKRRGIRLWSYKCPECKGWHLTKRQQVSRNVADEFEVIA